MRRANVLGKYHHLFGNAHFEIHARLQHVLEQQHIALLDMPAVFAQVHGNAIGARLFCIQRRLDRIRVTRAASLTQRGYVVDVYAEKNAIALGHGGSPEELTIRRTAYRSIQGLRNNSRLANGLPAK